MKEGGCVANLWLGTWEEVIRRERATWLRFYDVEGNVVLWPKELAEQAEANLQETQANLQETQANLDRERQIRLDAISRLREAGMSVEEIAEILSFSVEEVRLSIQDEWIFRESGDRAGWELGYKAV